MQLLMAYSPLPHNAEILQLDNFALPAGASGNVTPSGNMPLFISISIFYHVHRPVRSYLYCWGK